MRPTDCPRRNTRPPRHLRSAGFSLLEMVAAAALLAGTLVPAIAAMREGMRVSREATRRNLLATYAVQVMEQQGAQAMRDWTNATTTGDFAVDGYANLRYTTTRSDSAGAGGIVGRLMNIEATVYDDENGDSNLTAGELNVVFRTKVSKLLSYENEPN